MHGQISQTLNAVQLRRANSGEWEVLIVEHGKDVVATFTHEEYAQAFAAGQAHRLGVTVAYERGTNSL